MAVFELRMNENGKWRMFHSMKIHSLYRHLKARVVKLSWVGYVAIIEENKSAFEVLTGQLTEKRYLERPKHRW